MMAFPWKLADAGLVHPSACTAIAGFVPAGRVSFNSEQPPDSIETTTIAGRPARISLSVFILFPPCRG
jgi:hypothetical protein